MNYKYHYDALISSRKELLRVKGEGVYYERHHIVPRSMGGSDESSNLILLTGREHYIAHLLLWKMHPESKSMHYAFMVMCNKAITKVSSRIYETLRKNHSEIVSKYQSGKNHPMFGKTLSEDHREKLRELRTGSKQSAETVEKRASKNRGKKWTKPMSQEQRQKLSEIKKGKRNSPESYKRGAEKRRGLPRTERQLEALAEYNSNKIVSEETKSKISQKTKERMDAWGHPKVLENSQKWAMADYYYEVWTFLGCPGRAKMTTGYNKMHSDDCTRDYFESMVEKFQLGWVPNKDEKWLKFKENYYVALPSL